MEASSSPDSTSGQDQVANEEKENKINDSASVVIIGDTTSGYKNKLLVGYSIDQQPPQIKDALPTLDSGAILEDDAQVDTLENYVKDSDEDEYEVYEYGPEVFHYDSVYDLTSITNNLDLPPRVEVTIPWLLASPKTPSNRKMDEVIGDEGDIKFKSFKQFGIVEDYSDHFYADKRTIIIKTGALEEIKIDVVKKPTKEWVKRIQHEWKILEKDLPETIFVRVYEDRIDLLRAVIIGPVGTPYQDGLFFFDVQFPSSYPNDPPSVHYRCGGLQINPNLLECGEVCLSLLGTSYGEGCENWQPSYSTMLQVLVSVQALVFNEKPFLNEPFHEVMYKAPRREKRTLKYNGRVFVLSCKTMMYSLRNPPKNFEDLVAGHFRKQGCAILEECKAYMDDKGERSLSSKFRCLLQKVFEDLLVEFTIKGAADCDKFLAHYTKAVSGPPPKQQMQSQLDSDRI